MTVPFPLGRGTPVRKSPNNHPTKYKGMSTTRYTRVEDDVSVEVPSATVTMERAEAPRRRFLLKRAFCCLSLPTGVQILGVLDICAGILMFLAGVVVAGLRTHEHALDTAVEHSLEARWGNSTNSTQKIEDTIQQLNDGLNVAFAFLPLIFILAAIHFAFGCTGVQAATSQKAAKIYYIYYLTRCCFSFFIGSFIHFIFTFYAVFVVRSQWIALWDKEMLPAYQVVVTTTAPAGPPSKPEPPLVPTPEA